MNNPFDYTPDAACDEAFRRLTLALEALASSRRPEDVALCAELKKGKMLGVLRAADADGVCHTLYAFSGQLGSAGFLHPLFVEPVFDYLRPDGYFKSEERRISRINADIAMFEKGELAMASTLLEERKEALDAEVAAYRELCRRSKCERDRQRDAGLSDPQALAAMTRQSQFEKAELKRLKRDLQQRLEPFILRLRQAEATLASMKERRRAASEALQQWLFDNFKVLDARGLSCSLSDIFSDTPMRVPPSGAGECCAPKLLQAAYLRGWTPLAIAEYWYGPPKRGEIRMHGHHYPACRGKCLPVLSHMLQGLEVTPPLESDDDAELPPPEIIYENAWFCVVNKPSGMLSVPGKGRALSLQQWLEYKYGADREIRMAHRLDRDTSGLIIATFGDKPYKLMQMLFATRQVEKSYVAILDGDYRERDLPQRGRISLPLSPDWLDRPRQRVDFDGGKEAVTDYEFTEVTAGRTRVLFHPLTGRTHQLRMHAASRDGLAMPIAGDPLYGIRNESSPSRLMLHAASLRFTFPLDGETYSFTSPCPF